MNTSDLIRYITWYATQRDMKLTTVRLVKFVYLADLYYARSHSGKTITGYPWTFVHYGPYCSEVMGEIDRLVVAGLLRRDSFESRYSEKDYQLFTCRDSAVERIEELIPAEVLYPLRETIRKFGDDTQALLDHVYFETEPMEGVRKGDLLDFSTVRPIERMKRVELKKPCKKDIERGKESLARLVAKMKKRQQNLAQDTLESAGLMDETHLQACKLMNGDDLEAGLEGTARIRLK